MQAALRLTFAIASRMYITVSSLMTTRIFVI